MCVCVCVCVNIHLLGVEAVLAQVGEEFSDRAFQKGVFIKKSRDKAGTASRPLTDRISSQFL